MTEAMTPAEALRAMADNLDSGLPAMEGLEVRGLGCLWHKPHPYGGFVMEELCDGDAQVRRKPALTPAQKAGWKVGDVGRLKAYDLLLVLEEDDGTEAPYWTKVGGGEKLIFCFRHVERLIPESECKHD